MEDRDTDRNEDNRLGVETGGRLSTSRRGGGTKPRTVKETWAVSELLRFDAQKRQPEAKGARGEAVSDHAAQMPPNK